ncbi:NACHT domain-containing protein [Amycolatopsis sp. lyj-23]|uniref:NACHT domain-containing protein n=1 Tax=Amycolatopsis sp. lyj-23 TaxID=2789283 RepID=UPI00397E2612
MAQFLRELLERRPEPLGELSRYLNMSAQTLSNRVNARKRPDWDFVRSVVDLAFGAHDNESRLLKRHEAEQLWHHASPANTATPWQRRAAWLVPVKDGAGSASDPDTDVVQGDVEITGSDVPVMKSLPAVPEVGRARAETGVFGGSDALVSGTSKPVAGTVDGNFIVHQVPDKTAPAADYETNFRAGVADHNDHVQLIGLGRYERIQLSTAYIDLGVEPTGQVGVFTATTSTQLLDKHRLVLLEGAAGTGKSTVLRKLAVQAARGGLLGSKPRMPFLLRLRSFVVDDVLVLPKPNQFAAATAPLAGEPPDGWETGLLLSGQAVVLVDGIDEVRERHRSDVVQWLTDLTHWYPEASFIATSRPSALRDDWRSMLVCSGFIAAGLRTMTRAQVDRFITAWFEAQGELVPEAVWVAIATDSLLARQLTAPLLAASYCALFGRHHHDVRGSAFLDQVLELLLIRRDVVRAFRQLDWQVPAEVSRDLLCEIAWWLLINGEESIDLSTAKSFADSANHLDWADAQDRVDAEKLLWEIVEQTGLLQQNSLGGFELRIPGTGDQLAAEQAVRRNHLRHLVKHADHADYHNVIVRAAALDPKAEDMITAGLAKRASESGSRYFHLLAAECAATAGKTHGPAIDLLPPRDFYEARQVANASPDVLTALTRKIHATLSVAEAAASIRALALAGSSAFDALATRPEPEIRVELVAAWAMVPEPARYASNVLSKVLLDDLWVEPPTADLTGSVAELKLRKLRLPSTAGNYDLRTFARLVGATVRELSLVGTLIDDLGPLDGMPHLERVEITGLNANYARDGVEVVR